MKRLAAITTAELREAGLAVVRKAGEIESRGISRIIARQLGSSTYDAEALDVQSMHHHREVLAAENRWASRVRAQLDKLAAEGLIVKIGANETLPTGYSNGNIAHYFTPEAYEVAAQKHSDELKKMLAENRRWAGIEPWEDSKR